ncbi:TlpA family protein disulfide reductase [Sphingobacterium multivorum]|uniref:TlpA family protein disulfide reductase n=1 Tax=Sphingobacterium multivorum TaxID=28454 RepID=UPI003DA477CB
MMKSISNNLHKAFKSKRARAILLCLVSMFNLSAQTPRKDSGADGPISIVALRVGDYVPEDFWSHKVKIYNQGDTALVELAQYKGKPLLLDFWSTSCGACIYYFSKLIDIQKYYKGALNVLLVNSFVKRDNYATINRMADDVLRTHNLPSVYQDDYLIKLFPHDPIPHYVWISDEGRISAITIKELVNIDQVGILINLNRHDKDTD